MTFNALKCLEYVKDKSLDEGIRDDAAVSLIQAHPVKESADTFFDLIIDSSESIDFREEISSCLGSVWAEIGINKKQLESMEEQFKSIVMAEYELVSSKA